MSPTRETRILGALPLVQAALTFFGSADAGYLWWAHRNNIDVPCTSGGGCELVAQSRWAHITIGPWHDIPIALCGLLAYIALMSMSLGKWASETEQWRKLLNKLSLLVAAPGFAYSWYLQYVAHFYVGAFCIYCFSSACIMTLLFATLVWEYRLRSAAAGSDRQEETSQAPHVSTK